MALQDKLRDLFLLDQQVRGLRTRLDAGERRLKAQKNKCDQLERQRDEIAEQLKQAQARASGSEGEAMQIESRIVKLREQMSQVTSNKEYSALLVEINTIKLEKSKVEDQALEQMQQVDALRAELTAAEEKVANQQKLVAAARAEVDDARAEVGTRLDEVTAQRNAAAGEIPADVMSTFERLSEQHEGEAMAGIHEENRRAMEYTCGGCYMQIPVEHVNALIIKPDQVVSCPSCGRILYIDRELKASMGAK